MAEEQKIQIDISRSNEFRAIYSNTFKLSVTDNEAVLYFGRQEPGSLVDGIVHAKLNEECQIITSLKHLKEFHTVMGQVISDHEGKA